MRNRVLSAVGWVTALVTFACGGSGNDEGSPTGADGEEAVSGDVVAEASSEVAEASSESGTALVSGQFTLDEYGDFLSPEYFGVIEVDASPLAKRRLLDGSKPRRLANGDILYRRPCGESATQVMRADTNLRSVELTPCSNDSELFDETTRASFRHAALSADGTQLAVDFEYLIVATLASSYATVVFEVGTQRELAVWDGARAPVWMPSGRLLLASDLGLLLLDENLDNPELLGDVEGPVDNPAISPDETGIAFEFNQQIWGMNVDGTDATALVLAGSRLRFPAWSPDGRPVVAYLSNTGNDDYEEAIYVTDLATGENAAVDMAPVLSGINTVNGPLSWTLSP